MQQQDHNEILDTLNQYAEQFNSMVQKILTRQAGSADTGASATAGDPSSA